MGTSTDAILCFGIDLGGPDDERGFEPPPYDPENPDGDNGPADHVGECELVSHCSHECPMYILAAPGTKVLAYRGYPQEVKGLVVPRGSQEKLDAAMRKKLTF